MPFLFFAQTIDALNSRIERIKTKLEIVKKPMQPLAAFVKGGDGPPLFYAIIDDVKYLMPSAIRVIDVIFKSFHALNAQYPAQSAQPWILLQTVIYGFETAHDQLTPSILELRVPFASALKKV